MVENGHSYTTSRAVPEVPFARRQGSSFGVEVLSLTELRLRSLNHSIYQAHRIEFHILLAVTGGRGWHMVDFVRHSTRRGTIVHIAPGQIHRFGDDGLESGLLVLFQPEVCGLEAPHLRWPSCFETSTADFTLLETLLQTMSDLRHQELSVPSDRVAWRMLSAVLELCEGASERHLARAGTPRSEEFDAFETLLEENFAEHRDLSWYANRLGYSQKTLSRWSQRVVGTNAKTRIDRRVALEAKRLLVHTSLSVETISARLGFSESTNFVKFFKRIEGATPIGFRRTYN